ncbi:transcriptional regulator [Streptomyces spongiicola]|uniref:Transcriptional regulator n=1 Tax=Streptomyces spongiicola TaxID=1690221 RepID=A0ABM6V9B5_9ACTN|nr:LCP family protein [Streptomyces spongiicola]AWK10780.1 transcriptional regulator [Streptomyces spongiicola]
MTDQSSGRIHGTGRRRRPATARRRAATLARWSTAGLVLLGGAGLGGAYLKLDGNIQGVDISGRLGSDRPDDVDNGSLDVLVLGSDSRVGANGEYGRDEGGARSDTAMIVHIYEGHRKAAVVSVPRDTLVDRPSCTDSRGGSVPGEHRAMFNTAYEVGGPACAVKTVEQLSGVRMDHYIEVDFTGFKQLVDGLGGVDVTTTEAISDSASHLDLPPGTHTLSGEQALGLVRTRKAVGNGSDLGRIQLQQAFVKALIRQVGDVGVLSDPKRLYDLADTATKAITPDSDLDSVQELIGFANGLADLGADDIRMITLPVEYDEVDPNRVVPLEKQSEQVWTALRADLPIPATATEGTADGQAADIVE